ncbi:MAG: hypothetical protein EOQ89_03495 [Mesorhizobium sp.]|nr:MAG: hypothetical protein EOQ89_03495 [Mesorhizobium sp.]
MCIGGQPEAPINKPAYAPEEADAHFVSKIKNPDGTEQTLKQGGPVDATPAVATKPTVKTTPHPIRM